MNKNQMILRIATIDLHENMYIGIPDRWAALENECFIWLFDDASVVDRLYEERNSIIDEWLGTSNWVIIDYGTYEEFIHREGCDIELAYVFE